MNIKSFPNPKLNLPKELKDSKDEAKNKSFDAVDHYISMVGKYIYTGIDLNYKASDPMRVHAWIQKIVSSLVLRSLYLRNEFVETINSENAVAFYLPLKAWFEVTGALAYILEILEKKLSPEDLSEEIKPFALGNKYKGELKVGNVEAKNVLTMIGKGNKYLDNMSKEIEGNKGDTASETFFTDYYDTANFRIKSGNENGENLQKLLNLCKKFSGELVVCVSDFAVSPENNTAERAIRPAVLMRKISGGSRSKKGAKIHETNLSVIETINRENRKQDIYPAIKNLVLNYLTSNG